MSKNERQRLPDYERPPVIEVVCSVQFDPIPGLHAPAIGLFWQQIREEYSRVEIKPPLAAVRETYPARLEAASVEMSVLPPLPRTFFIDATDNWLVQIQQDRFVHNWRKVREEDVYPHFPEVYRRFANVWHVFGAFCEMEGMGPPVVNQLELTYINHIPAGTCWHSLADMGMVFRDLPWSHDEPRFLPEPESMAWKAAFLLPSRQGRLHVSVRHAVRNDDSRHVILCELTARGMPAQTNEAGLTDWFSLGREWIVQGFADLTCERIQQEVWGRKS
ncbi:MAG: TIGR04255 family protein [Pirellulales bacterium]